MSPLLAGVDTIFVVQNNKSSCIEACKYSRVIQKAELNSKKKQKKKHAVDFTISDAAGN